MRGFWLGGAAAAALVLAGCGEGRAERAEDSGPPVSRNFAVAGFSKIEVSGPFDVNVTTGGQPSVAARGPEKLVGKMVVEVDGDTLKIHPEKRSGMFGGFNWGSRRGKAQVAVSVPMLSAADIAGSGDIAVNRISGERFQGSVAGSGGLKLPDVTVRSLQLEIAGSGGVMAQGRAAQASYEIAGSGDIDAGAVQTEEASAEIAGSGNIAAHAARTAKVDIAGSGNVKITGGAKCSISKAGSGNVDCS